MERCRLSIMILPASRLLFPVPDFLLAEAAPPRILLSLLIERLRWRTEYFGPPVDDFTLPGAFRCFCVDVINWGRNLGRFDAIVCYRLPLRISCYKKLPSRVPPKADAEPVELYLDCTYVLIILSYRRYYSWCCGGLALASEYFACSVFGVVLISTEEEGSGSKKAICAAIAICSCYESFKVWLYGVNKANYC